MSNRDHHIRVVERIGFEPIQTWSFNPVLYRWSYLSRRALVTAFHSPFIPISSIKINLSDNSEQIIVLKHLPFLNLKI